MRCSKPRRFSRKERSSAITSTSSKKRLIAGIIGKNAFKKSSTAPGARGADSAARKALNSASSAGSTNASWLAG